MATEKKQQASPKPRCKRAGTTVATITPHTIEEMQDAAKHYGVRCIERLAEVMNDKKQSGSAVVAAANAILDRAYGKVRQGVDADVRGGFTITWADSE